MSGVMMALAAAGGNAPAEKTAASIRVRCQRPDGKDFAHLTFIDRAEFERFCSERPRDLWVTDISEYEASTCDEALEVVREMLAADPDACPMCGSAVDVDTGFCASCKETVW